MITSAEEMTPVDLGDLSFLFKSRQTSEAAQPQLKPLRSWKDGLWDQQQTRFYTHLIQTHFFCFYMERFMLRGHDLHERSSTNNPQTSTNFSAGHQSSFHMSPRTICPFLSNNTFHLRRSYLHCLGPTGLLQTLRETAPTSPFTL